MSVNAVFGCVFFLALATGKVQSCESAYPVALDTLGPRPCPLPPVASSHSTPVIEKPVIQLPALIPFPRTISNKCRCMKTIVKPQVIHQFINVPTVQRYIETRHRPVVEKIHYNAYPVNGRVRDLCGNAAYYDDGVYADCCRVPVAAAIPVRTAIPVAAAVPIRGYPVVTRCYETCAC